MKILYLTPGCFDKGGISRYSRYQIRALRDLFGEDQVRVLSLDGEDEESFESEFNVHWAGSGNATDQKVKFSLQALKASLFWRPDVIHVAHVNFSGMAHVMAKLCGAKTILNTYGLEVWSGLSADAVYGLRNVDCVLSDCHFTANYLEDEAYRKKGTVPVIWDCVDLERFSPGQNGFSKEVIEKYKVPNPDEHFIIMSLGRLSKGAMHKGYDRLIEVFSKLSPQCEKARLVIAGKGDNKSYLEQLVEEAGISAKVTFTGMVEEDHMVPLYRMASVFSLVSDRGKGRGEGIPLTPLEAMACGVPVIVGNQDGSQEAIDEDRNGSVIDPFDFDTHQQKLLELYQQKKLWQTKKDEAVKVAHERFSFESFREKHRKLYKRLDFTIR